MSTNQIAKVILEYQGTTKNRALKELLEAIIREIGRGNLRVKETTIFETNAHSQYRTVVEVVNCALRKSGSITIRIRNRHLFGPVQKVVVKFAKKWGLAEVVLIDDDGEQWR